MDQRAASLELTNALASRESCAFRVKWTNVRTDGRVGKADVSGTESGTFSFVILEKQIRKNSQEAPPRILEVGIFVAEISKPNDR